MRHKKETGKDTEHKKTDNVAENPENIAGYEEKAIAGENAPEEDPNVRINELNDKLLRLYSEFDNYRKRTIKEKTELSRTASEDLITELLPVLDDFDRAMKSFETTDSLEALKEGVQLIYSKLRNILTNKGLQEISSLGENFDTDHQEAIAHIPAPSEDQKNKVVDEVVKGYKLNEKVIRFAKVVVGS